MAPSTAFWHLLNLFAPALGMGLIAPTLAKLLWRTSLRRVSWLRLSVSVAVATGLVIVAGLMTFGHDGKMSTYAAMTLVCALTLWWVGFRSSSR